MDSNQAKARLKQALKAKKVTQDELAKTLGVSRALVGHWATGERLLDRETVDSIAKALHVDPTWLAGENLPEVKISSAAWDFPIPIPGQRDFGNANVYSFKAKIDTLTREAGQNSLDARDDASSGIVMRYRLIELRGAEVQMFRSALAWDHLRAHIEASCQNKAKSKLARLLAAGLERVDKNPERLLLLRIDDFGTRGLTGSEAGSGAFAALVRNNLDSDKGSQTAGGSFGLGKGVHWICSDVKTVLFNTVTALHHSRVIARSELTYHTRDGAEHAGPGWFGNVGNERFAESIADESLAVRLYLGRDPLPKELKELVPHEYGTSILIVAFQDPASDELDEPAAIIDHIEQSVALNFWPAIRRKRLAVIIEHQLNAQIRSQKIVDPSSFVPDLCEMLSKHLAKETTDSFAQAEDVVETTVPIRIPKRKLEPRHAAVDSQAVLLIGTVDPDEFSEATLKKMSSSEAARARVRRERLNTVALVRGALMVTQYAKKENILVGARPFNGVILAGEASGTSEDNKYVEQFFRASEPPAHDAWSFTDDLRETYERGARAELERFHQGIGNALRKVLRTPTKDESDGPEELRKLLRLGGDPGASLREGLAVLRNVFAQLVGTQWIVKADVVIKKRERELQITPRLALNVEAGQAHVVEWQKLEIVGNPAGVSRTENPGTFIAKGGVARFTFKGTTLATALPVDPRRCTARLGLVASTKGVQR